MIKLWWLHNFSFSCSPTHP